MTTPTTQYDRIRAQFPDSIFFGPFDQANDLDPSAGVYMILNAQNGDVIDVGSAAFDVRDRISNSHSQRVACWHRSGNMLQYAAVYDESLSTRETIENWIRNTFNPPCHG